MNKQIQKKGRQLPIGFYIIYKLNIAPQTSWRRIMFGSNSN